MRVNPAKSLAPFFFLALLAAHDGAKPEPPPRAPAIGADLKACGFFSKRSASSDFIPNAWALTASGIGIFRRHKAFDALTSDDYRRSPLGIVDSGLKIFGNPAAGGPDNPNVKSSPEVDEMGHGTMVFGVAASRFGVEPRLSVKMFKVPITRSDYPTTRGKMDLDHAGIINQIDAALDDDSVKVINASIVMRMPPSDVIKAVFRKAKEKKKFLVLAAGNDREVGNSWKRALPELGENPYVLVVGGTSYLGAPSSFSNIGPGIDIYAPASRVDTMSSYYNPYSSDVPDAHPIDGTSFAAPHVAAVLAKLLIAFPKLSPAAVRLALKYSAINRGARPRVPQLNAPLLVELVSRASGCLEKAGDETGPTVLCLEKADAAAQADVGFPAVPPAKEPTDCPAWRRYFDSLEEGYFLSRGAARFSDGIMKFLAAAGAGDLAERFLYLPGEAPDAEERAALVASIDKAPSGRDFLDEEKKAAKAFYRGELGDKILFDALPAELTRLVADGKTKEAIDRFWELCRDHFFKEKKRGCASALSASPASLLAPLADKILADGAPVGVIQSIFDDSIGQGPEAAAFRARLAVKAADGCAVSPVRCGNPYGLLALLPGLSPADRDRFLAAFDKARKADYSPADSWIRDQYEHGYWRNLAWANRALTPEEETKAKEAMHSADWMRAENAEVQFQWMRFAAGHGSEEKLLASIGAVKTSPADKPLGREFGNWIAYVGAWSNELAEKVAGLWSDRKFVDALAQQRVFSGENFQVLAPWLTRLPPSKAAPVIDALVRTAFTGTGPQLLQLLESLRSIPRAAEWLEKLESRGTGKLQEARLALLERRAKTATRTDADVRAFIDEDPRPLGEKVWELTPRVVLADPALESALAEALDGNKDSREELVGWLSRHAESHARESAAWLARRGKKTAGKLDDAGRLSLLHVAGKLDAQGALTPGALQSILSAGVRSAEKHAASPAEAEPFLAGCLQAAGTKAGLACLASEPKIAARIAAAIVKAGDYPYDRDSFRHVPAPAPVADELRNRLPRSAKEELPRWAYGFFAADPASLPLALDFLKASPDARLRRSITDLLQEYPKLHRELEARKDFEALKTLIQGEKK